MEVTGGLVVSPHPVLAACGREVVLEPAHPGEPVSGYAARHGVALDPERHWVAINDRLLSPEEWGTVCPRAGDLVIVRARPAGGGDSNPLGTILSLAVMFAAPYVTPALFGQAFAASFAGRIFTGLVVMGGNLLVNALMPAPKPHLARASTPASPSPTYSLAGGSNAARPFAALPLVIGTHRIFPDLDTKPYTTFEGRDQYLYQTFNFGLGDVSVSDLRIGDTPISNYQGVTTQWSTNGQLDLFPANVDVATGGTLTPSTTITRQSATNATGLQVDIEGQLFSVNQSTGATEPLGVSVDIEYRALPSGAWQPFVGSSAAVSLTNASSSVFRWSAFRQVSAGDYEVRMTRTTADYTGTNQFDDLTWTQLKTYQPDAGTYEGMTRLAVKIRASGQLQGRLDRLSGVASSKAEVWTGSAWTAPQATSNPAWLFRWFAKGATDAAGRIMFGAGLTDAQLDLDAIKAWGAWCDTKGLTCNAVIDREMTLAEVLELIARTGRASPTWASGKLGIVYDQSGQAAVQVFGPGNIIANTFAIEYLADGAPEEVVVRFVNPALDWQQDTIRATVPGVTGTPKKSTTVDLIGVTDKTQAGKEALLLAASQYYHNRRISWETDLEGLVAQRGDVVIVSHDLTTWGYSGRLVKGRGRTNLLAWSEDFSRSVWTLSTVSVSLSGNTDAETGRPIWLCTFTGTDPYVHQSVSQAPDGRTFTMKVRIRGLGNTVGKKCRLFLAGWTGSAHEDITTQQLTLIASFQDLTLTHTFAAPSSTSLVARVDLVEDSPVVNEEVEIVFTQLEEAATAGAYIATWDQAITDEATQHVTCDRALPFTAGQTHYVQIRYPTGALKIHQVADQSPSRDHAELQLLDPIPDDATYPAPDNNTTNEPVDYIYAFEPSATPGHKVKIIDTRPRDLRTVQIVAIDEVDAYYDAENGSAGYTPPPVFGGADPYLDNLEVSEELIRAGSGFATRIALTWRVTGDYHHTEIRGYVGGGLVLPMGVSHTDTYAFTAPDSGTLYVELTPYAPDGRPGNTATKTYAIAGKTLPPPDVDTFTVQVQPDGTREFSWSLSSPPADLAGYEIRAKLGTGHTWAQMSPLHAGLLTSSPYETNQLAAGTYTAAIKAVDTSGNYSNNATVIESTLGDPRMKSALLYRDLVALGWPGTKTNCAVDNGALMVLSQDTWDTLPASWDTWLSWSRNLYASAVYEDSEIDLGIDVTFRPLGSVDAVNCNPTIEYRWKLAGGAYNAYQAVSGPITARYVQMRVSLAVIDAAQDARLKAANLKLDAEIITDELRDIDLSTLTAETGGGVRLPLTKSFSAIYNVLLALQSVGSGYTWEVIDKNATSGPWVKVYDSNGTLAYPTIDAIVRGI